MFAFGMFTARWFVLNGGKCNQLEIWMKIFKIRLWTSEYKPVNIDDGNTITVPSEPQCSSMFYNFHTKIALCRKFHITVTV